MVEAHTMAAATSLFGDIPFRQAGDRLNYSNPAYDPQEQVYVDLSCCKSAIARSAQGGGAGNPGNPSQRLANAIQGRY